MIHNEEVVLRLDTSKFEAAMRAATRMGQQLAEAFTRAAEAFGKIARSLFPVAEFEVHMARFGPCNLDVEDDTWQTDLCAAWVHDSCPSPAYCDCTCHGGMRR